MDDGSRQFAGMPCAILLPNRLSSEDHRRRAHGHSIKVADREKFHGPAGSRCGQVWRDVSWNSGMSLSTIAVSRYAPQPREEYTMTRTISEGLIDEQGVTARGQLPHLDQNSGRRDSFRFVDFLRWWLFVRRRVFS
ncbi:hypothetical protein AVEN_195302-1 [Araneus ventricosus]|uniref:Uncharacterized protein n=1 Tax=Araneus ventricosus TaxID=182803 RepID=A0A4Y2SAL3_ARAVE|nr:hypothetical protein AVEN_195302-1 [Araneus ventricosus]